MLTVQEAQYNWPITEGTRLNRTREMLPYWILAQYMGELDMCVRSVPLISAPGSVMIIPPDTPHSYICHHEMRHHWLHISSGMDELLCRYRLEPNRLYYPQNPAELSDLFRTVSYTYHERGPFFEEYMSVKVEEILARTAIMLSEEALPEISYSLKTSIRTLRGELLAHPEEHWSISMMAQRICLSESYLFPLYKSVFGVSPAYDLSSIRVERACTMLRDGLSVAEVGEKCGYSSVYHFIRQFRNRMGVTPGQYRKR